MDRARSKPDYLGNLQRQIKDVYAQIQTLRNQNLALPDWITPVLGNAWGNVGGEEAVSYWRDSGGIVVLRGMTTGGGAGSSPFTLPVGFRPSGNRRFPVYANGATQYVTVPNTGVITISGGTNVDLAGVRFRADG